MLNFEEFEQRQDAEISRLFQQAEAAVEGNGSLPPGVAGEVAKEFRPLMKHKGKIWRKKMTDAEIDEMTEDVLNRVYKLVT